METRRPAGVRPGFGAVVRAALLVLVAASVFSVLGPGAVSTSAAQEVGSGSISGRLTAPAGHSTEGFLVRVSRAIEDGAGTYWSHVVTGRADAQGRWRVDGLVAGRYRLQAYQEWATQLVNRFHGGQASPHTAEDVVVTDGEAVTGIVTPLAVGGTISGTVRSRTGTPLVTINVLAYEAVDVYGTGTLDWQLVRGITTNHDGTYELDRLREAPHRIQFVDPLARGWERTYYPGVAGEDEATVLDVSAGKRTAHVDVRLTGGPTVRPKVRAVTKPRRKGKPVVGRTLRVTRGTWDPSRVQVKYQWFAKAGGKAVKVRAGKRPRLKVTRALRGKRVRAKVTVTAPGHRSTSVTTKWTPRVRRR